MPWEEQKRGMKSEGRRESRSTFGGQLCRKLDVYGDKRKHYLEEDLRSREGFLKMQLPKACLSRDGWDEDVGAKLP